MRTNNCCKLDKPLLAKVEVAYSDSMIEAFGRSLKHGWLFLNRLDTFAAVERLVEFYVRQHNSVMPHAAFNGSTPDEVYFGTDKHLSSDLRSRARWPDNNDFSPTEPPRAVLARLPNQRRISP